MLSDMLELLLTAGFIAWVGAAIIPSVPPPLGTSLWEARLPGSTPSPGNSSGHGPAAPQSWGEGGARDRFKRTRNYSHLHRYSGRPLGESGAPTSLAVTRSRDGIQNITDLNHGFWYGVNVTFDTQELTLVLDTGSSDTWAFSTATQCVGTSGDGGEGAEGGDALCVFGPPFQGDFPLITFENMHFSTEYWGNQTINGTLGLMDVTVGGLRVTSQTVGLAANTTRWYGRGPSSGVLGLAYPGLTKAFIDSDIGADPVLYPPVISNMNMVGDGVMEGGFSLALNRPGSGEDGGVIVFGEVPYDVPGVDWNSTAQTDIIVVSDSLRPMLVSYLVRYMARSSADLSRRSSIMNLPRGLIIHSTQSYQMSGCSKIPFSRTGKSHTTSTAAHLSFAYRLVSLLPKPCRVFTSIPPTGCNH